MPHFDSYEQVQDYMDRLGLFRMELGLGRMEAFWQHHHMPTMPIVHVVGTNGKGSTSTFLESLARAHRVCTGLFTSPHLVTPRERIRINGSMVGAGTWVQLANKILATPGGTELTYFEFQTCLAMLAFAEQGGEVAIMEAGLGGRFDATNIFKPGVTLFTPIGLDHEAILGNTLEAIAMDKAGAMHTGSIAFTAVQEPSVATVLAEEALRVGARLSSIHLESESRLPALGLRGVHQKGNARLALEGWHCIARQMNVDVDAVAIARGLKHAFIPGRFHEVTLEDGTSLILDGAHNVHAMTALSQTLCAENIRPSALVFACMADKNTSSMVPLLHSMTDGPILCPAMPWDRAAQPSVLAASLGPQAQVVSGMEEAVKLASSFSSSAPILLCGSLYLLASFYELHSEFLNNCSS